MNEPTSPASHQPAVTVEEISDPTSANTGIELLELDAVQLHSLPLRVRRVTVRLDGAAVVYTSSNQRARSHTSARAGRLAYVTFGPQAAGTVNGLPVRPGLLLAVEPATEVRFVVGAGWQSVTFLVAPGEVQKHLAVRGRESEFHLPSGVEVLQADPERVRGLYDWGKRLTETAEQMPELFDQRRLELGVVRSELLEVLLATLGGADGFESGGRDRTLQAQSRIVRAAEAYALEHVADQLRVSDLCRACSVSERTLDYAFKKTMGLTPVAYLTRLRLHRVRQALLAATPGTTTVSIEALNWGFWHFGEFSRAYRECFGELPSVTLRRKP